MITINNLRKGYLFDKCDVRVDRQSILGNPFHMNNESQRDEVCDKYEEYFKSQIETNQDFKKEIDRLITIYLVNGELNLFCWCAPKRCHAETIKSYILNTTKDKVKNTSTDSVGKSMVRKMIEQYENGR